MSLNPTFVASPITKPLDNDLVNDLINKPARKCVGETHKPSVQMYFTLRQKIDTSTSSWLEEFLELGGLERLLDTLCHMTGREFTNFSDAILQLDCISCVRSILNRKSGMEFLLQREHYMEKLVTATFFVSEANLTRNLQYIVHGSIDIRHYWDRLCQNTVISRVLYLMRKQLDMGTGQGIFHAFFTTANAQMLNLATEIVNGEVLSTGNTMPKKQIFELLTAICGYNNTGLLMVWSALTQLYKKSADQTHKLSRVLTELSQSDVAVTYKTCVLSFINTLVNCLPDLCDRVRVRTELTGLGLCEQLAAFRRQDFDADLHVQIEIYETEKYKDDVTLHKQTQIDADDSFQLFDLIYSKVFGRPKHTYFLQILQDLAMLEVSKKNNGEMKWEWIRDAVHTITTKDNSEPTCVSTVHFHCNICEHCCDVVKTSTDVSQSTVKYGGDGSTITGPGDREFTDFSERTVTTTDCGYVSQHGTNATPTESGISDYASRNNSKDGDSTLKMTSQDGVTPLSNNTSTNITPNTINNASTNITPTTINQRSSDNNCTPTKIPHNDIPKNILQNNTQNCINHSGASTPKTTSQKNVKQHSVNAKTTSLAIHSVSALKTTSETNTVTTKMTTSLAMAKVILDLTPEDDVRKRDCDNELFIREDRVPACEMLPVKWAPITQDALSVFEKPTLWDTKLTINCKQMDLDLAQLEQLFCDGSMKQDVDEVQLVDDTTALRLNLLLHRLDTTPADLATTIHNNDPSLTLATLKYLNDVLPSHQMIDSLHRHTGPLTSLSPPDQLLIHLSTNPDYRELLNTQLMVREMTTKLQSLKTNVDMIMKACNQLMDSTNFARFMQFALDTGNVLNHNKHNGQASGFKLSSLSQYDAVKSATPRNTLLKHLVTMATDIDPMVFKFVVELATLDKAAKLNIYEITDEMSRLEKQWRTMEIRLSNSEAVQTLLDCAIETVNQDFYTLQSGLCELKVVADRLANYVCEDADDVDLAFCTYKMTVNQDFYTLQSGLCELKVIADRLANYVCEDPDDFDLAGCFSDVSEFIATIQCYRLEIKASKRDTGCPTMNRVSELKTSAKDRKMTLDFGREAGASSSFVEDKSQIIEAVLSDVHRGMFLPSDTPDVCSTPDESLPWELSCISPGGAYSPAVIRPPLAKMETFSEFNSSAASKCATSSVNDLLDSKTPFTHPNPAPDVSTPCHARRKLCTLYRSHSDLNLTLKSAQKRFQNNDAQRQINEAKVEKTTAKILRQISLDPLDLSVNEARSPAVLLPGPTVRIPQSSLASRSQEFKRPLSVMCPLSEDVIVRYDDLLPGSQDYTTSNVVKNVDFKIPKAYVNSGPAGNRLESNFKRNYRAPVASASDPNRESKKRASIMGNIVNRFTRVVLKPRSENSGKSRWSRRDKKPKDDFDVKDNKDNKKDVKNEIEKLEANQNKVKESKKGKRKENDENKENKGSEKGEGRRSFKMRFSRRGKDRENEVKGVMWNNMGESRELGGENYVKFDSGVEEALETPVLANEKLV